MKLRICKMSSVLMMALILAGGFATPAKAAEVQNQQTIIMRAGESEAVPYADHIVIYTRTRNGVWQYRRWNATRAYWVDPDWIDM